MTTGDKTTIFTTTPEATTQPVDHPQQNDVAKQMLRVSLNRDKKQSGRNLICQFPAITKCKTTF
jgi:hypothetical protein